MKRVKGRWNTEYPASRRTAQNLIDNARRFKKKGWGRPAELENRDETEVQQQTQVVGEQQRKSTEWTTEMKMVLVMLDEDERPNGRGFMKRVKDRWNMKYPEHESARWQKLRDNSTRFEKDPEIKNLIPMRRRKEVQVAEVVIENNLRMKAILVSQL